MRRLYDCFLLNDERELVEIRIRLLKDVVDKFVVVWAHETFTGKEKQFDKEGRVEKFRRKYSMKKQEPKKKVETEEE